ncbi:MAG: putative bifunctional diguanylate cyclase/phosphodiesterase [Nocardioides sp.]
MEGTPASGAAPGSTSRARGAWGMLAAGLLMAASVSVVRNATYTGLVMAAVSLGAVVSIVVGIRRHRPQNRRFWSLCAWALGTSVVAGVLTTVLPSTPAAVRVIDATYLAGYTMLVAGGLTAIPARGERRDWAGILDALVLAMAGAVLFWFYELRPTLAGPLTFHTVVSGVVWPVYDLLLIVVAIRLATSPAPRRFPFWMVVIALASSVVTDFWFALSSTHGGYVWGSVSDAFWVLPMTALGTAALHPAMHEFAAARQGDRLRITWARVFLVGFAAFTVPIAITVNALLTDQLRAAMPTVIIGSILLAVTGVARTAEMVRQARNSAERAQALSVQQRTALDEAERLHEELVHTALYDPLTGLANRRLFSERLELTLAREDRACAVMFIDLDDFKNINDSLGHAVGDLALVELGSRIESTLRSNDTVARLGGDEFAVLIVDDPTPDALRALGERLLATVSEPLDVVGTTLEMRISVGIACSDMSSHKDDLLRNADIALYSAKEAGKNRFALFVDAMRRSRMERLELTAELRAALDNDELAVVYQPVVDLRDGKVDGVEALVRWTRTNGDIVPTPDLIGLAEETGLILPLGRYVLRQATAQARQWRELGLHLNVAVNVSAMQLTDPGFLEAVGRAADVLGRDQVLVLELTESALIGGDPRDVEILNSLRDLGCRIAIDDFGTGFSSLAYLQDLPVDILKIAGTFVDGIDRSSGQTSVAKAVLGLGMALDYLVVAEGIEHPAEAATLRSLGCTLGQGYLFARPASADALLPYLVSTCRHVDGPRDAVPTS